MESGDPYGLWSIYTRNLEGEWKQIYTFDCTPENTSYSFSKDEILEPFDAFLFVRDSEEPSEHICSYYVYDFVVG